MKKLSILILCLITTFYFCGKNKEEQSVKEINLKPQPKVEVIPQTKVEPVSEPTKTEETKQVDPEKKQVEKIIEKTTDNISEKEITSAQLWQKYRESREASKEALNNSQFQQAIDRLKVAAINAEKLDRGDLAAWQYNNIGYYSILEFKGITNYDYRLHQLRAITEKEANKQYLADTKKVFNDNIKILRDAKIHLERALEIDASYTEKNRTEKIKSNLQFINWIENFIKN